MKLVFVSLLLSAGLAAADTHSFRDVPARAGAGPQQPTLYSFADVYRLTVSGPMRAPAGADDEDGALAGAPIRVAAATAQPGLEPRFAVRSVPQPDKWMLALAGLALAGWVAHRRLSNSL
jgi:hypothetical protein